MKHEAQVVIIGGGVAGALIASTLAANGIDVLVVEAGAPIDDRLDAVGRWAASPTKTLSSPYREADNHAFAWFPDGTKDYDGNLKFKSTYMRRSGGSTWHWQGSTPRLVPNDFRMASMFGRGVDWPLTYDELEPWYGLAEVELGVAGDHQEWDGVHGAFRSTRFPMPSIWPSYSDREFAERVDGMEIDGRDVVIRRTPQARNSQPYQDRPACAGNSTCIPICPIGAKYDATVHLRRALGASTPARLLTRTVATKLRFHNEAVEAVELKRWAPGGAVVDETAVSTRGVYIVAAHAIESVRLLLLSAARDRSGQLGKNLMDHPTGQMVGMTPEPWYPFRGPPVTSGVDGWRDGAFRAETAAWKASLGNDGHGRFASPEARVFEWMKAGAIGADLRKKIMDDGPRMFRMSWATEQLPDAANRMELSTNPAHVDAFQLPRASLQYDIGDYTRASFSTIRSAVVQMFAKAGIRNVQMDADPTTYGGSGHILGTCRMGTDASKAVVDSFGRSFDHPSLFVVGSALFPTVGTANPTLTVAAVALRTAEHIRKTL